MQLHVELAPQVIFDYVRSPAELLLEVILVDDASTKDNLGSQLGEICLSM
jgi:hypothetical protein